MAFFMLQTFPFRLHPGILSSIRFLCSIFASRLIFMKAIYYLLPVVAGLAMAVQSIVNGQLRTSIGSPFMAALISFATGTVVLVIMNVLMSQSFSSFKTLHQIHWMRLTGGALGVIVVTSVILSIQKIPTANMFALLVTSQLIGAVLLDHYGWMGIKQSPIITTKAIGILLLIAGAYLVNKK